jgi:hypothetical protein
MLWGDGWLLVADAQATKVDLLLMHNVPNDSIVPSLTRNTLRLATMVLRRSLGRILCFGARHDLISTVQLTTFTRSTNVSTSISLSLAPSEK